MRMLFVHTVTLSILFVCLQIPVHVDGASAFIKQCSNAFECQAECNWADMKLCYYGECFCRYPDGKHCKFDDHCSSRCGFESAICRLGKCYCNGILLQNECEDAIDCTVRCGNKDTICNRGHCYCKPNKP